MTDIERIRQICKEAIEKNFDSGALVNTHKGSSIMQVYIKTGGKPIAYVIVIQE